MADQEVDHWIRLPFNLDFTVDLDQIGLSRLTLPTTGSGSPGLSTLVATPGPYSDTDWALFYRLEAVHSIRTEPRPPHDVRLTAIETVVAAELLDRVARLLSEAIDVNTNPAFSRTGYDKAADGIYRASRSYLQSLLNFNEPWSPGNPKVSQDYVHFELLELAPGTLSGKVGIWIRRSAIVGFFALLANIISVTHGVGDAVRMVMHPDSAHQEAYVQTLTQHQLDKINNHHNYRVMQENLAFLGCDPGTSDGRYGPKTELALRKFENEHHLPKYDADNPVLNEAIARAVAKKLVE